MRRPITFTKGLALGALAMFFWDPRNGQRRRSQVRDKTLGFFKGVDGAVQGGLTDLGNRLEGIKSGTKKVLRQKGMQELPGAESVTKALDEGAGGFMSALREPLSPGVRWAVGAAGGALILSVLPRCSMKRLGLGALGLALVARAVANASVEEKEEAPEDGSRKSEVRGQKLEAQKSEIRGQKSEAQKPEPQKSEAGR